MDPWDSVRLRTPSTYWNAPVKYGPRGELFFVKKEPVASNGVPSSPFVSVETLRACSLVGLHLLAAQVDARSSGSLSLHLGDMWRHGFPMSPEWVSSCSASETSFGCEVYEHNNECRAIEVGRIGQARWCEDWKLGRVAWSCHMAVDLLCQEMRDACWDSLELLGFPCLL